MGFGNLIFENRASATFSLRTSECANNLDPKSISYRSTDQALLAGTDFCFSLPGLLIFKIMEYKRFAESLCHFNN